MTYEDGRNRTRATGKALTAIALIVATTAALASVAAAGPLAAKQRIEIINAKGGASFVLNPLMPGAIKRDAGAFAACCWSNRSITRNGERIDINDPQITMTGKQGTLVMRNRIEFVDIPDGEAVFTGTWSVVRGTGAYAGLTGGGRVAGVQLADGSTKSQFQGFLSQQ